jgi:hypothetical protein
MQFTPLEGAEIKPGKHSDASMLQVFQIPLGSPVKAPSHFPLGV